MENRIVLCDRQGHTVKTGDFTEPEMRMAAKAGYRVFAEGKEITQSLTGLFDRSDPPGPEQPPPAPR